MGLLSVRQRVAQSRGLKLSLRGPLAAGRADTVINGKLALAPNQIGDELCGWLPQRSMLDRNKLSWTEKNVTKTVFPLVFFFPRQL